MPDMGSEDGVEVPAFKTQRSKKKKKLVRVSCLDSFVKTTVNEERAGSL